MGCGWGDGEGGVEGEKLLLSAGEGMDYPTP